MKCKEKQRLINLMSRISFTSTMPGLVALDKNIESLTGDVEGLINMGLGILQLGTAFNVAAVAKSAARALDKIIMATIESEIADISNLNKKELDRLTDAAVTSGNTELQQRIETVQNESQMLRIFARDLEAKIAAVRHFDDLVKIDKNIENLAGDVESLINMGFGVYDLCKWHGINTYRIEKAFNRIISSTFAVLDTISCIENGVQKDQAVVNAIKPIKSQNQALRYIKDVLLPRSGSAVSCTMLHIAETGEVQPALHTIDYGIMVRALESAHSLRIAKVRAGDTLRRVKRYVYDVLFLHAEGQISTGLFAVHPILDENGEIVKKAGLKNIYRTLDEKFWISCKLGDVPSMIDITSWFYAGQDYKTKTKKYAQESLSIDAWKAKYADCGFWFYSGAWSTSSPGELKAHVLRLPGEWIKPGEVKGVNWEGFYSAATSGAWTDFNKKGGTEQYNAIAEFNSRCTLSNAYAAYFDDIPVRSYGYFAGKFKVDKKYDLSIDGEAYEAMDGTTLISAEYLALALNATIERLRNTTKHPQYYCELMAETLVGTYYQNRIHNVNKVMSLAVSEQGMKAVIDWLIPEEDRIHFFVPDMTQEQQEAVNKLMANKAKPDAICEVDGVEVNLKNKLVVLHYDYDRYLAKELPDYLTDANGQKATFDLDRESGPHILAVAHEDDKKAVMSTQIAASYAASDFDKTQKMLKVLAGMEIDRAEKELLNEEGQYLSYNDFKRQTIIAADAETGEEVRTECEPNYPDLVMKAIPCFALKYNTTAWRNKLNQTLKMLSKMFNSLNIPIPGTHTTILPDLGVIFAGVPVLKMHENGIPDIFSKTDIATTITADQYKTLVTAAGITGAAKDAIFEAIDTLAPGISVVPADEWTARANEGWDYDGDSMYSFKFNKGYKTVDGHYVWCSDEEAEDYVTIGHINRYPKGHPFGYMKTLAQSWLKDPYCVVIEG